MPSLWRSNISETHHNRMPKIPARTTKHQIGYDPRHRMRPNKVENNKMILF